MPEIPLEPDEPPADAEPNVTDIPHTANRPPFRRLRVFAFDPLLSNQLDTLAINEVTLPVVWEEGLKPGPSGEYLEVVDYDPGGECFYRPVDLNDPYLLATDGLSPSEGNPQFHQQMVYAVAMTTIRHFEQALGRRALWSSRRYDETESGEEEFVQQLRIYPHGLREANAYYSPDKKALLFGYFPSSSESAGRNLPGGLVFTCLSHDVVSHETTHALLDGMHGRFIEPSNADTLAFHEAFADIVALFQHFTFPDVLRSQIASTRGDLAGQNQLGKLAQQFGEAIGSHGALRDSLGKNNPVTGEWEPRPADPSAIGRTTEPHDRGAILVAAVFDAFVQIYKRRVADLLRIATGGSGILPAGELHPDLVNRLATEASKAAGHMLTMCIRALDYCPPVDLTFGEYLRALITADRELIEDDDLGYRTAVIEAFRRRGLYPQDVRSLATDSLVWDGPLNLIGHATNLRDHIGSARSALLAHLNRWNLSADRKKVFEETRHVRGLLHSWFAEVRDSYDIAEMERITGLALSLQAPLSIRRDAAGFPIFEVHGAWPARRVGPDGQLVQNLVIQITQKRAGYFDANVQQQADRGELSDGISPDFVFRGGVTVVLNFETAEPRYFIRKGILSEPRRRRQAEYLTGSSGASLRATYFGERKPSEPFALLHRGD